MLAPRNCGDRDALYDITLSRSRCSDSVSNTFFILDSSLIAVGFLAVVIQLIDMNSKVVSYFNDIKDAPKDRAKLARMATGLLALLIDLICQVEEENTSTSPWFADLRLLEEKGGPLMKFKSVGGADS